MRNKQKAWRLGAIVINGLRGVTGQVKARHDKTAAGVLASGEGRRRILQQESRKGEQRLAPCGYTQNDWRTRTDFGLLGFDHATIQAAINAAGFDEGAPA